MLDEWAYKLRSYQRQVLRALSTPRPQFVARFTLTLPGFGSTEPSNLKDWKGFIPMRRGVES